MGQKVNPKIFRIGITGTWNSKWFSGKNYAAKLEADVKIRKFLESKLKEASIDSVVIDRTADTLEININTARPGVIIGRGGASIEELKNHITKKIVRNKKIKIQINIKEVPKPNLSARIIAQNIALDLEKRIPHRKTMKKYIEQVMKSGGLGVKIHCSGRLGGAEIARRETLAEGKIPLHTLRADIDYARLAAHTTYGAIGIKVWIYKGDVFNTANNIK
ncbi:30S ribosomal protein S3 [Candidatus Kuenenbacteria bacterium RIFCSPLOWO2_12_FULL_42_13]|uniref:Small ribosomal subunit protein uS3 n=5 Tax=Candidatus Kueneniibacteriota TaxID=1752740 RepID=A0A0G0YWU4_9BACT|nr:MAG: 30S ribosomal protein S3 [Candidatus Kuenenbacteria bacterium GW2011_GWA2_42_15]OGG89419.1 MAG: 30S ribosomal protein S3 [Candidatus Kuenenbacteria bacterium RIFCSPHIGHO2_02_FULL_42_29]OGG89776.1 MAG: 30S ribosomal protein S3 [Candidatus Kuenenbacteria bacterium RIFCSPLOWO2_02_FULL_42_16]OGG91711.1 MAG: 30S ribosomal protein S3 [Candidatus Kuenenbacteria bacterium RIFCSPLOWO2_12_FULL_42_13]OGG95796.1 MAG: 30S ribosomal protein S3 [Candidatus Kuenenbacteria bacterium RBG_16_41_7]OGH0125